LDGSRYLRERVGQLSRDESELLGHILGSQFDAMLTSEDDYPVTDR
jgi:hypothetical protein